MTRLERRRPRPTRRAAIHAVLGLALYGAGANVAAGWVLVVAGVVLATLPWAAVSVWRAAGSVEVARDLPPHATAGLPVRVGLRVRASSPASIVVSDRLTGASGATGDPRDGVELVGTTALRRGIVDGGDVEATVTDLLGLFTVRATGHVPSRCEVVPADDRRDGAAAPVVAGGPAAATERGDGVEVIGTRDHVTGDPLRHVHWRSVARRGRLVVREMAGGQTAPLVVAIDGGVWRRDLLDEATAVASGLAATAAARGRPVSLVADGEKLRWGPSARRRLAGLAPHAGAPARPLRRPPGGGALVVTGDGDRVVVRGPDGDDLTVGSVTGGGPVADGGTDP